MVEQAKSPSGTLNGNLKETTIREVEVDGEGEKGPIEEEEESDEYDEEGIEDAEWEGEEAGEDAEGDDDYEEDEGESNGPGLTALLLGKRGAAEAEEEEEEEDEEYTEDATDLPPIVDVGIGKKRSIDEITEEVGEFAGEVDGENGAKKVRV